MNLSTEDVSFLRSQLARHAKHVEDELAHTDARSMQRELAQDLAHLQAILTQLDAARLSS